MMLTEKSLQKVEDIVDDLLVKFSISTSPIPVQEIAEKLGLKIIPYDLSDGVSGLLVIDNETATIGFNPSNSKERQRFTISHQIGHFLLHNSSKNEVFIDRDFIVKYRSEKKYNTSEIKQEQEANAFAAALLMPRDMVQKEMDKKENKDLSETEFIEALSKTFEVSVSAATFRLSQINLY